MIAMSNFNLLSIAEAAAEAKKRKQSLSARRLQALCKQQRLGQKVGSRYVIDAAELRSFLAKPRSSGRPKKPKIISLDNGTRMRIVFAK